MKSLLFAAGVLSARAVLALPTLTVQDVAQDSETAVVTVSYKLTEAPAVVTVDVQTNAGGGVWASIGGAHLRHWAGDVNRLVAADADKVRTARWFADRDWPGFVLDGSTARAVVKVWPQDDPPDYMVVDAAAPTNVSYYVDADSLPLGVKDRVYMTDRFVLRRIHAANVVWLMGSPSTEPGRSADNEGQHPVMLTADYYLGVYPVTQFQWQRVKNGDAGTWRSSVEHLLHPVESVSWNQIRGGDWIADGHGNLTSGTFMDKVRLRTGVLFDLPTSAQWEYACRAGTMTSLYTGVSPTYTPSSGTPNYSLETDAIGWNWHNNAEDPECVTNSNGLTTHVVCMKPANPWGLYDMLGNTWDMCLDWYASDVPSETEIQVDPKGPAQAQTGDMRSHVWRGGDSAAHKAASYLRAARNYTYGDNSSAFACTGFRLACPVEAVGCFVNEGGAQ